MKRSTPPARARRWLRRLRWAASYLWALPYTVVGLGLAALAGRGGQVAWVAGVLEASGGAIGALLRRFPVRGQVTALTLGHVILALDERTMEEVRDHERVHVRQFAAWGPFFLPAYAVASIVALAAKRDPYLGNAFERQAFRPSSGTTPALPGEERRRPV